ncbi:putative ATP-dependent carboligase [Methanocella conradii HZ254]|uniref:ATP-dependent carboligase n=1 Tax=Methanocella conradii (strain DSM 24694 / JCM 17849 / CGMCC 1.5162 / HZ254) TaxID=1041930 RepID=H8I9N5_METCZ|nr:ATP-grasp domain-containing protein [Methanocella conradii]AFD00486.1 putative ATP-dependent carboligase [Methanocella conradii HZ254]
MAPSILVVGYNARVMACPARRAGYKVYSLSHYDDLDLLRCVEKNFTFSGELPSDIRPWLDHLDVDYVVLGSGFEGLDLPASLVLGNDPKVARDVINKVWLAEKLNKLGLPHPRIFRKKGDIAFPCVAKPIKGGGGVKNFLVKDESMLPDGDEYFLQEYVEGKPLSVSVLSTGSEAMPISVNEILVGKKWLGQCREFGYCGNVTPYETRFKRQMFDIARELVPALGLVGHNGIDFIVNKDGPMVLEVNPRFTGAVDSVELATGENLFKAHVDAINGKLHEYRIRRYGAKAILFARRHTVVRGSLLKPMIADVPKPGNVYENGEAICTIMGAGRTRGEAIGRLKERLGFVKKSLYTARAYKT